MFCRMKTPEDNHILGSLFVLLFVCDDLFRVTVKEVLPFNYKVLGVDVRFVKA